MESCTSVEKEIDKVLNKFQLFNEHSNKALTDLIDFVNGRISDLSESDSSAELSETQTLILSQCTKRIRDAIGALASEHRDLHGAVSKVGKAIDKSFVSDFSATSNEEVFQGLENMCLLNHVLSEHFLRQGMLEIAEEIIREAGLRVDGEKKEPFSELNRILDALKNRNLQPALEWTHTNREQLLEQNSSLEFKLHRLHFIDLLQQGVSKQADAICYARQNFQDLASHHERGYKADKPGVHPEPEIQVLMGSLLYLRQGLHNSPYSYLLDPVHWAEICDVFTRDACALLGLSVESPLTVCVNAGCMALPALLNIKQVMQQRQVTGVWSAKDELPIEIDLGKRCRFHSIFACPILRQQSSETNPPMRLVCGHVISRDALHKLASGNKLKCPYCPLEQNPTDARLIHF